MSGAVSPSAGGAAALGNTSPVWRRAWHAVAHAEEVTAEAPVQVLIAGEEWVITRLDGRLAAFEDRCPHRLAPLSAGHITAEADGTARLACAYHGWRFDAAGRCDLIPSLGRQGNISKRARLRPAHGVAEAYGLIWLAPDEPLAPLPAFGEWDAPGMTSARSRDPTGPRTCAWTCRMSPSPSCSPACRRTRTRPASSS
jgi:vanillate O-demethylase monooxygenase subunit